MQSWVKAAWFFAGSVTSLVQKVSFTQLGPLSCGCNNPNGVIQIGRSIKSWSMARIESNS